MTQKKYVSLSKLSTFLNNLKSLFATKAEVNTKADSDELLNYYTKTETDSLELITVGDIDAICDNEN